MQPSPFKTKYFPMYMNMAIEASKRSVAVRRKVGAVVVTPTGMISPGWNGMPVGWDNTCETFKDTKWSNEHQKILPVTKPEVIHAERNAIDKMTRQGISTFGSMLFVTVAPCFECAKAIHALGLEQIIYLEDHSCNQGIDFLNKCDIPIIQYFP